MRTPKRSRYERRSRARQRRVQRRLDQVRRQRRGRDARGAAATRIPFRRVRLAIFTCSLLVGLGLARTVTATAISWWTEGPVVLEAIAVQGAKRLTGEAIAVQGAKRLTGEEIAVATGLSRGGPIDALSSDALAQQVETHPWVRSARVAVLPTGTVIVDVDERRPRALLRSPDPSGKRDVWRFVDDEGVVFADVPARLSRAESAEVARLPALAMRDSSDELGTSAAASDPTIRDALALLDRLDGLALEGFARHDQPHRGLELMLPDGNAERGWVLRRTHGDRQVILGGGNVATVSGRLDRLERLLSAGLAETRVTASIDMRFAGQAVLQAKGDSR